MLGGRTCAWRRRWNVERPLPVLIAWDGRTWAWRKAERPPLVLTAWGGRTCAWYRVERPLPVLTAWDGRTRAWLWRRKIERPPLILIVLGGRTRAHLDDPSPRVVEWRSPLGLEKVTEEVKKHNTLWSASAPFECCQTYLVLILLRYGRLDDRIEENNKMVIVGWGWFFQVPSYYDTVLYNNSRLL